MFDRFDWLWDWYEGRREKLFRRKKSAVYALVNEMKKHKRMLAEDLLVMRVNQIPRALFSQRVGALAQQNQKKHSLTMVSRQVASSGVPGFHAVYRTCAWAYAKPALAR